MWNLAPLIIASMMAGIDVFVLSGLKQYSLGIRGNWIIPLAMAIYSIQPVLFLHALRHESMTVMNILWDVTSDVYVTAVGLFYFKERLTPHKLLGLAFAFIAIVLFAFDEVS